MDSPEATDAHYLVGFARRDRVLGRVRLHRRDITP